jgi:UDP-glucose 4-epimerase
LLRTDSLDLHSDASTMNVLVTGGAGYIGAHVCVELIRAGYQAVILDNFCNSSPEVLKRIARITGVEPILVKADVRDRSAVAYALTANDCKAVIHLAGLKSVAESIRSPADYYDSNVVGSLALIEAMSDCSIGRLVFASTAAVYGEPVYLPIDEGHPLSPCSPYGRSKLMTETMLEDMAGSALRVAVLRFFNPVGAHESGLIGDNPLGTPSNVMPYLSEVAVGRRPYLEIFGDDYGTPDGTGIRDFVHVMDVAAGHLRGLRLLETHPFLRVNLGTGKGSSVLELLRAFSRESGQDIDFRFGPRRPGDVARSYASAQRARELLGWSAARSLRDICYDEWQWRRNNPDGYATDGIRGEALRWHSTTLA